MARSYLGIRPKVHLVYSINDVMLLYGVCRNTPTNWIKTGLRPVDDLQPLLFVGPELTRFHKERALPRARPLRVGEFKCLKCKAAVFPAPDTVKIQRRDFRTPVARAVCPDCSGSPFKLLSESDCDRIERCIESNMSLDTIDEEDGWQAAHIGKDRQLDDPNWNPSNERILYLFHIYAKRFDAKTIDAKFSTIRNFEGFLGKKSFDRLKPADIDSYREQLKRLGNPGDDGSLSRSTIRHHASHLRQFLDWLVKQDGYRRLNHSLPDYAVLPKNTTAALLDPPPRTYPDAEEPAQLLKSMPIKTCIERRNRAIIAAAFLFGVRADTLASLRIGDVGLEDRSLTVDASKVRAKNSKSFIIWWFPVGKLFADVVGEWVAELCMLGANADDALFPPDENLKSNLGLTRDEGGPVVPWKGSDSIRKAFSDACETAGLLHYTPHSVRHYLKALGNKVCRTEEEREAWSKNMGHTSQQITKSYYATMNAQKRQAIFVRIRMGDTETVEDLYRLVAYHEHRLIPGTEEFRFADELNEARRQRFRA